MTLLLRLPILQTVAVIGFVAIEVIENEMIIVIIKIDDNIEIEVE